MAIQRIHLTHLGHKRSLHTPEKRAACGSAGFYTAPKASSVQSANDPMLITWDVNCMDPAPSSGKLDFYLYTPTIKTSTNPRAHIWKNVPFSDGSFSAQLNPEWWNYTSPVTLQLKAIDAGNKDIWMSSLPAAPLFNVTYSKETPLTSDAISASTKNDFDAKPEPESSHRGKIAAAVLIPLLFIGACVLAYMKWQRKKTSERRKSFADHVDKRMSTISTDWRSMSAAGAQAAIRASMAGDPRASGFSFGHGAGGIRPMSTASSMQNQAGFGAGGGYAVQPEMAQTTRTVGVGLRSSAYSNAQAAERVSRISFAESAHPRPRPSGESRRSAYERRSVAGQSRAFHNGFVPPLPNHGHSASIGTSHLNVSTTTLDTTLAQEADDAMSPKQKAGAFSLSTEDIRMRVGGMERDEDVGPALSMMRSQATEYPTAEEEAQYANMPTLPTPVHTKTFESDDPTLFTASPITPSFPNGNPFTPTSGTIGNIPYTPMSPDDMLRAYAERQKAQAGGNNNNGGVQRVMSPPVGRPLAGGAMSPSRGAYGVEPTA
ncbi:hypothetical protein VNI00_009558 [Paramarasmius palmivorus]|uniref:Uncharacterized protein n=1 Tax=Paramarasmius palmivorus TaxID=297713 RepID=A0AAW0CRG0_9AGAR